MKTYLIMGSYRGGEWEEIDEIEGRREASRIVLEYRMAFGNEWSIKKEQVK